MNTITVQDVEICGFKMYIGIPEWILVSQFWNFSKKVKKKFVIIYGYCNKFEIFSRTAGTINLDKHEIVFDSTRQQHVFIFPKFCH